MRTKADLFKFNSLCVRRKTVLLKLQFIISDYKQSIEILFLG